MADSLEYFIAGLPAKVLFDMDCGELEKIASSSKDERGHLNKTAEICFIGLASYFEAFCKNQFASIVNICPQTLQTFTSKRDGVTIELKDMIKIYGTLNHKLGSLLSEKYDFGSARAINSLYYDLLGITPFSTKEAKQYDEFLNDRNLLVHHGGVYTFKYHGQRLANKPIKDSVHWNSLIVGKQEFQESLTFLRSIVDKITTSSHRALKDFIRHEKIRLTSKRKEALETILWSYDE